MSQAIRASKIMLRLARTHPDIHKQAVKFGMGAKTAQVIAEGLDIEGAGPHLTIDEFLTKVEDKLNGE